MSCIDCPPEPQVLGANPANIHWKVVRGDTAKIRVSFFETNENANLNTNGWTYTATAYNPTTNIYDELSVVVGENYIDIIASPEITESWGTANSGTIAELVFDLEIIVPGETGEDDDTVWTPVIGTIVVLADVTRGL